MGSFSSEIQNSDAEEEAINAVEPYVSMDGRKPLRKGSKKWSRKKKSHVLLQGYVMADEGEAVQVQHQRGAMSTAKSLTDEDLDELKGCLDLGFGFSYEEIPELCNTLPALELCYSMSQRFLDEQQQQQKSPEASVASSTTAETYGAVASPIANWKISSPGDDPDEVKARLKFWAQAVACTVRLCS